ncbi:MAG: glycosyltransferase, partial [Saprospiraceae bacterium]|nr:glycosyltransferase [Saprospiraceae bacterium]
IFVFEVLMQVKANINLDIIANLEDKSYWSECQRYINDLPKNIVVNFLGPQPHNTIEKEIEKSHLFFLPTKGENFGHAIFESLASGRPVLISDQTPWTGLEAKNAGWDLPLNDKAAFVKAIEQMAQMDQITYDEMCRSAHKMAENYVHSQNFVEQYKGLFSA